MRARWILAAVAVAPIAKAASDGVRYTVRASAARRQGEPLEPGVPAPAPSAGLAASVALDRLFVMPMGLLASAFSADHYERSSQELDAAVRFYDARGWLDDPAGYFVKSSRPIEPRVAVTNEGELLTFESGWSPHPGEIGGERWQRIETNATVPVTLLRHDGRPRPWLVAIHGQGMGTRADAGILRVRRLHHELGVNVALPVLPLHGPRRAGLAPDRQFVSNVYPTNNVLGLGQAMWDVQRLIAWLRDDQQAPSVGVLGLSLGAYASSLLSTIDRDLACVVAVVPSGDLAGALRAAEPLQPKKRRLHFRVHDWRSTLVHRVVSPLARPCLVPRDRRFIVAGQGDQVAPPAGAALLAEHWERPAIKWRPRGHLTTGMSSSYDDHLNAILTKSGLRAG